MSIVPDAGIAVGDAPALLDRGGFDEHDARAALGELAQMHEMPVADVAVERGVLAHRRDDDAVARLDVAQLYLFKQHWLWFSLNKKHRRGLHRNRQSPGYSVSRRNQPHVLHKSMLGRCPERWNRRIQPAGAFKIQPIELELRAG